MAGGGAVAGVGLCVGFVSAAESGVGVGVRGVLLEWGHGVGLRGCDAEGALRVWGGAGIGGGLGTLAGGGVVREGGGGIAAGVGVLHESGLGLLAGVAVPERAGLVEAAAGSGSGLAGGYQGLVGVAGVGMVGVGGNGHGLVGHPGDGRLEASVAFVQQAGDQVVGVHRGHVGLQLLAWKVCVVCLLVF